jgi:hypothetical protein
MQLTIQQPADMRDKAARNLEGSIETYDYYKHNSPF